MHRIRKRSQKTHRYHRGTYVYTYVHAHIIILKTSIIPLMIQHLGYES